MKYYAQLHSDSTDWGVQRFDTLKDCKDWAAEYGDTIKSMSVYLTKNDELVARYTVQNRKLVKAVV